MERENSICCNTGRNFLLISTFLGLSFAFTLFLSANAKGDVYPGCSVVCNPYTLSTDGGTWAFFEHDGGDWNTISSEPTIFTYTQPSAGNGGNIALPIIGSTVWGNGIYEAEFTTGATFLSDDEVGVVAIVDSTSLYGAPAENLPTAGYIATLSNDHGVKIIKVTGEAIDSAASTAGTTLVPGDFIVDFADPSAPSSLQGNTTYRLKFKICDGRLSLKVWEASGSEPAHFQLVVRDQDPIYIRDAMGLFAKQRTGDVLTFNQFSYACNAEDCAATVAPITPPPVLISRYEFEGNLNDSIGGLHGTPVILNTWSPQPATLDYVTGVYVGSQALRINQANPFEPAAAIALPPLAEDLNPGSEDWSYTIWIKDNFSSRTATLYSARSGGTRSTVPTSDYEGWALSSIAHGVFLNVSPNSVSCPDEADDNYSAFDPQYFLQDGFWHHVAVTVDRDNLAKFYIDGKHDGNFTNPFPALIASSRFIHSIARWIGGDPLGGGSPETLDDARYYNYVLSDDVIRTIAKSVDNVDTDHDGIVNAFDNCYRDANADQLDSDNDGEGNVCDTSCVATAADDATCDGVDDDCDLLTDEDYISIATSCGGQPGTCPASGATSCVSGHVEDSCVPGVPQSEVCDGVDNDCDGIIDDNDICGCVPSPEVCDAMDNDCDGQVDEEGGDTYYEDLDGDDYGSSVAVQFCTSPPGYSTLSGDCDDSDVAVHPGASEICDGIDNNCDALIDENGVCDCVPQPEICDGFDNNCDGLVDEGCGCVPQPEVCDGADNDCNGMVDEGCGGCVPAPELCNGIDDNCDGMVDEGGICGCTPQPELCDFADNDCDGLVDEGGVCGCMPQPEVCDGVDNDCNGLIDDGGACGCAPQPEVCNGIDDDCNGMVDEGCGCVPQPEVCDGIDNDCDGMVDNGCGGCVPQPEICDGVDNDCNRIVDEGCGCVPSPEVCDGLDNDCNGMVDEGGVCGCMPQPEICDGLDNDCDGIVDNGCGGCVPQPELCGDGLDNDCDGIIDNGCTACVPQPEICDGIDNDCNGMVDEGSPEVCDGDDNDCDGMVDEGIASTPTTCGTGACVATGELACIAGTFQDSCSAGSASAEVCDNIDNDCDGTVDNGIASSPTSCGVGACASTGSLSCVAGSLQDSCVAGSASAEVCDGLDNNCDGNVDEGVQLSFFRDVDGDGEGDGTTEILACVAPAGYITNGFDCDDANASVNHNAAEVCDGLDNDCDRSIDEDFASQPTSCGVGSCASTGNTTCVAGAIVDSCTAGSPSAELCDSVDNDCDGTVDEDIASSATSCGVGSCASTGTLSCVNGALVDSCVAGTGSAESCDNIDNDCDGAIDNGIASSATSCGIGACASSGTLSCVNGALVDSCVAGTAAANDASCDGIDNDCNGTADEDFVGSATSCGVGACAASGTTSCVGGLEVVSCTPGSPAANDASCNGIDDDCSGAIDEDFVSDATSCGVGACAANGTTSCVAGSVQDSCTAGVGTANDATCNGIDDDCSGVADEDFVSAATSCGVGACAATGSTSCSSGTVVDSCSAGTPSAEVCDGSDNNCNGSTDEGVLLTFYRDADSDSFGNLSVTTLACSAPAGYVSSSTDCNDANAAIKPGAAEICDLIDNDCDAAIDEGVLLTFYRDADSDGFGASGPTTQACSAPVGYASNNTDCNDLDGAVNPGATEVCDGIDNNCSAGIDEGSVCTTPGPVDSDGDGATDRAELRLSSVAGGQVTDKTVIDYQIDAANGGKLDFDPLLGSFIYTHPAPLGGASFTSTIPDGASIVAGRQLIITVVEDVANNTNYINIRNLDLEAGETKSVVLPAALRTNKVCIIDDSAVPNTEVQEVLGAAGCNKAPKYAVSCNGSPVSSGDGAIYTCTPSADETYYTVTGLRNTLVMTFPDDDDNDGFRAPADCNDSDAAINSDAEEVCDSVDNNCDGSIDEGNICGEVDGVSDANEQQLQSLGPLVAAVPGTSPTVPITLGAMDDLVNAIYQTNSTLISKSEAQTFTTLFSNADSVSNVNAKIAILSALISQFSNKIEDPFIRSVLIGYTTFLIGELSGN